MLETCRSRAIPVRRRLRHNKLGTPASSRHLRSRMLNMHCTCKLVQVPPLCDVHVWRRTRRQLCRKHRSVPSPWLRYDPGLPGSCGASGARRAPFCSG